MVGAVESYCWNLFIWTDPEVDTRLSEPAVLFDLTGELLAHAFADQDPTPIREITATTRLRGLVCDMGKAELRRIHILS